MEEIDIEQSKMPHIQVNMWSMHKTETTEVYQNPVEGEEYVGPT